MIELLTFLLGLTIGYIARSFKRQKFSATIKEDKIMIEEIKINRIDKVEYIPDANQVELEELEKPAFTKFLKRFVKPNKK